MIAGLLTISPQSIAMMLPIVLHTTTAAATTPSLRRGTGG